MGGLPARLVLGPALRAQSDRRLVGLVRDGYESAFEEIVRRYRRPLDRFAASIVGGRSEDVTQDSFRKALEALRRGDAEVELRPWLYRIVRNTALNDLRDRPPAAAELADELVGGGRSAAAEAEQRVEVAALTARMRALPEKQRAALVMRELEGMSHDEIAAALGISGGAARQAIARARTAVRSGFGALVPLPLLRALASAGGEAAGTALGSAAAVGGTGGVGALKVGLATVLVAGSIGAGAAVEHHGGDHSPGPSRAVASAPGGPTGAGNLASSFPVLSVNGHESGSPSGDEPQTTVDDRSPRSRGHDERRRVRDNGDSRGKGDEGNDGESQAIAPSAAVAVDDHNRGGRTSGDNGDSRSTGGDRGDDSAGGRDGDPGSDGSQDDDGSRHGTGAGDAGSRHGESGSGDSGSRSGGSGRDGDSGSSGGTNGSRDSDDLPAVVVGTAPAEASASGSPGSGSSSGGPGPSSGSGPSGGDASPTPTTPSTSDSQGGPSSPSVESTTTTDEDSHSGGSSGDS
jgi:RNA polymerase sigma factor (sigma-70 family)